MWVTLAGNSTLILPDPKGDSVPRPAGLHVQGSGSLTSTLLSGDRGQCPVGVAPMLAAEWSKLRGRLRGTFLWIHTLGVFFPVLWVGF